jgi:UDP-2,3-diacylglucosamine hydrolase
MAAFFFSDVHLGLGDRVAEKAKEDRLLGFLEEIRPDTELLFIVGDLFDFWFEYATVIPRGFHRTLAALQSFTDAGKTIHYLVGNHDCWMGDFFEKEIGVNMHRDPFGIVVQEKRVFVHHGDGLADNDIGYRLIKPVLRNPIAVRAYRWLHPDIGVRLARGTSRTSRDYTTNKHYGEESGMLRHAQRLIAAGAQIVVMGHHHRASRVDTGGGVYINLGDWITSHTYGVMNNGMIQLVAWNGPPEVGHGR